MAFLRRSILARLGLPAVVVFLAPTLLRGQEGAGVRVGVECRDLARLAASPSGFGRLVNPVLENRGEIEREAEARRRMLECLGPLPSGTSLPDGFAPFRYQLELFLAFAGDEAGLELIDLGSVRDPAVERLRREVGLLPPDGLVFVRYYPSYDDMPELVRRAFSDPETRAVTISSRYVAVLAGAGSPSVPFEPSARATLSHELVHAFLNAGLGPEAASRGFPAWFQEGMAIHFSGSGRAHVVLDSSGGRIRIAPTAEYERYERVFIYLEDRLGRERFYRVLRSTIARVDTTPLLGAVDAPDYQTLQSDAEAWWRWWPVPVSWIDGGGVWVFLCAVSLLLAAGVAGWRRWQPAVAGSALERNLNRDLLAAARSGAAAEVAYLLRSGANPDTRDRTGWTPLAWSVWLGRSDVADVLLGRGARVSPEVRVMAAWKSDPDIERIVADAVGRRREIW